MLKATDVITVKVNAKWVDQAIDYAMKSWSQTFNRMGKDPYSRLKNISIGIIGEKAVESVLTDLGVDFDVLGKTKWYEIDRYDLSIADLQIDVKGSFLETDSVFYSKNISKYNGIINDWAIACQALVPLDQFNSVSAKKRAGKRDKRYIFPFVEGVLPTADSDGIRCHIFWDYKWLKKGNDKDLGQLGKLKITYGSKKDEKDKSITIFGTTAEKIIKTETIKLGKGPVTTTNSFYQVFTVKWNGAEPKHLLTIESLEHRLQEHIYPEIGFRAGKPAQKGDYPSPLQNDWKIVGLTAGKVHVLGFIDDAEMRIKGKLIPRFAKTVGQYSETKVDNWGVAVRTLKPINQISKS